MQMSRRLVALLDRVQPPESLVLVVTALIVGLGAGLGAVVFRYLIAGVQTASFTWLPQLFGGWNWTYIAIVPALGGLIVGPLVYFFAREAKGHGVPEVMEAVALQGGRIRPIVAIIKSLASSFCIGTGGSVGREGPIVQIGSALGSTMGQALHLSEARIRNLVACGSAGGIAATFNSPIAGVIFALEIILGEFSISHFSTVVISAVAASVVGQAFFGNVPAFPLPEVYQIVNVWEFGLYPILAVLAAAMAAVFVRSLYWAEDTFDAIKRVPEWVKPAIGGALLGGVALLYGTIPELQYDHLPQVYGVGYEIIEQALSGNLALWVVLALAGLKLLATIITLGSGGSGGVFAPSLFMGAMLGAGFGGVLNTLLPGSVAPPGAYALVGMAAVFAGAAHAPLTAVIILFELTGDYRIILPLMFTVVISTLLARWWLSGESIYTLKLTRRGIRLVAGRDIDVLQSVTVEEVMSTEVDSIDENVTIGALGAAFDVTHHHGLPVLSRDGNLVGIVTINDLDVALARGVSHSTTVTEIATMGNLLVAYPDEPMSAALQRMGTRDVGRMPVVSREDPTRLLGLVRRNDIVRAYHVALTRRATIQHETKRIKLRNVDGTEFVEITLTPDSVVVGKRLVQVKGCLPEDCVLVSLRRDGQVLIPHGNTDFRAGDRVTAFVNMKSKDDLHECLLGEGAR